MSTLAGPAAPPLIRAAAAEFETVLRDGDPAAPVPPCPGWTLTDLADHLGRVHRWARNAVVERQPLEWEGETPPAGAALAEWFAAGADDLVGALEAAGPDAEAWGFGPKPRTAAFWFRRQVHETGMHAWDARASQGTEAPYAGGDPAVALDGIDEVATMFFPRQVRLGRIEPPARGLALEAGGRRWVLGPGDAVDATIAGPAEAVLLAVWHRIPLTDRRLAVTGDPAPLLRGATP